MLQVRRRRAAAGASRHTPAGAAGSSWFQTRLPRRERAAFFWIPSQGFARCGSSARDRLVGFAVRPALALLNAGRASESRSRPTRSGRNSRRTSRQVGNLCRTTSLRSQLAQTVTASVLASSAALQDSIALKSEEREAVGGQADAQSLCSPASLLARLGPSFCPASPLPARSQRRPDESSEACGAAARGEAVQR